MKLLIKIKILKVLFIGILVIFVSHISSQVQADITPSPTFPSCPGPFGQTLASYSSGNFAIVGLTGLQSGSDSVFQVDQNHIVQCFCPTEGATGIQTNWLAANNLSSQDQQALINSGWTLIQNGSGWGLSAIPYLTLNSNFSCIQATSTPTPTSSISPTPTPTSSQTNQSSSNSPPIGGGSIGAPICGDTKPSSTTLLSVTPNSSSTVVLNWTTASGANNYSISYGYLPNNYSFGVPSTGNVSSFQIGGLKLPKQYCFSVLPINGCQPGDFSNVICTPKSAGTVLGTSTQKGEVLGISTLAHTDSTKTLPILLMTFIVGILSLAYGLLLKKTVIKA